MKRKCPSQTKRKTCPKCGILLLLLFLSAAGLLGACGKEQAEAVDTKLGIDGYVYLPRLIPSANAADYQITDDYIYYYTNSSIARTRLSFPDGQNPEPDFSSKEYLFRGPSTSVPKMMSEYPAESDNRILNDLRSHFMESGKELYSLFTTNYFAVDANENLYYYVLASAGNIVDSGNNTFQMAVDPMGGMLYKQTPDGEIAYGLFLPPISGLAADNENVYALTAQGIYVIDAQGRRTKIINNSAYVSESSLGTFSGSLLSSPKGHVYYMVSSGAVHTVLEIAGSDPQLKDIPSLAAVSSSYASVTADGNLLFYQNRENMVYEYDRTTSQLTAVMRWEDCDMYGSSIRNVIRLSPDTLMAEYRQNESPALYLLTKTSVDSLPPKETIVLASLSPTEEMRNAVINFNRNSSQYHVIIETYGSSLSWDDGEARLDATLVSSTPPDLLDLHNVFKYADRNAMEDLTPYLKDSSEVPLDDYLNNVVEGYTINGNLVCIPTTFSVFFTCGRASQLDSIGVTGGLNMEDVYALTEKYPDSVILHSGYASGSYEKSFVLERFCSAWFLEKFVDWEQGTCSFDSGEFRRMLTWLEEFSGEHTEIPRDPITGYSYDPSVYIPENALLSMPGFNDFEVSLVREEHLFQEDIRLVGMPTADGRNRGYIFIRDSLGITSNSRNKEGAWAFLEYFLSKDKTAGMYLPTRKSQLDQLYTSAITPPPTDEHTGQYKSTNILYYSIGDEPLYPYYFTPQPLADQLMNAILTLDFSPLPAESEKIVAIVLEEMESYYSSSKSLDEVIEVIQNRSQLLLNETR